MTSESSQKGVQYAYVVYDAKSGDVHHVHQVAVLPGAESPTHEEMEERALALAKKLGRHGSAQLKVLKVAPEHLLPQSKHSVDLKKLKLISRPIQQKPRD